MFLSKESETLYRAKFNKMKDKLFHRIPKLKYSESINEKEIFKDEFKYLEILFTNIRSDNIKFQGKALEHYELMHMYSEMIELTEAKERGAPRGLYRKEKGKFEDKVKQANNLCRLAQSPYFGRIDFHFSKNTEDIEYKDKKRTFFIGKTGESIGNFKITDWRAPISSVYYNFPKPSNNCFYKTDEKMITGKLLVKRKIDIENATLLQVFDGEDLTSLVGSDPFLLKQLKKNSSNELKDIISTIQSEQNKIISLEMDNDIIVQGVAGSGKSSIAIHRLSWLLYNYKNLNPKRCLIIAPSRLFLKYIKNLLPEIGSENVPQSTFNDWAKIKLKEVLEKETIKEFKRTDTSEKQSSLKYMKYIEKVGKKYNKDKIPTNKILDIYKKHTKVKEITTNDLAPLLYLKTILKGINENEKIDYLVVDEAQDHSPSEIFVLKRFADTGRTMLVGDLLQGIVNPNGIKSWDDLINQMYDPKKISFFRIQTSYRSTKAIIEFVNKNLEKMGIPINHLPKPVLREGQIPQVCNEDDLDNIVTKINEIYLKEIAQERFNIAIIVPEKFIELFKEELSPYIPNLTLLNENTRYDGKVALGDVRTFKGLEFDTVIFVNLSESIDSNIDTKNFYVACTRAMHSLYIINKD